MEAETTPPEETRPLSTSERAIEEAERDNNRRRSQERREADQFYLDGHQ
jgi:hypothetical protein